MERKNAYQLAHLADCGEPDTLDSAGAKFLLSVQDDVIERHEYDPEGLAWDREDAWSDVSCEIADAAPDVYTHARWREFVDLTAYNEDLDDLGGSSGDSTQDAGAALYMIAQRLVSALVSEFADETEEDE